MASTVDRGLTRRWLIEYPRAVPVAIFLLVMSITLLSVFAIERGARLKEQANMRETARAVASALERRGATASSYLRAGAALFSTAGEVQPDIFTRFVSELRMDSDYRGVEGLGWAQAVNAADAAEFERDRLSGAPGEVKIRPAPTNARAILFPVTYLLPDTPRNRRALGYDMYSEAVRREAMDSSVLSGRPTASGMVVLQQEGRRKAPGFLIYMPVMMSAGGGERLAGFIYSPFNAKDFLESALILENQGDKGVRLYDDHLSDGGTLIAELPPERLTGMTITRPVQVANRTMMLEVESSRGSALSQMSMLTLIFGLMVASLLMLIARLLTQQAVEDQSSLRWLAEQNSIRNTLTRELNHRVKNTLANVLSIIALTRRRATRLDDFADTLDGRIRALSATHDLLTQSEWGETPISDLVRAELAPYVQGDSAAVTSSGPDVELAPNDALSLGLALHELSTNAAKYGALSVPDGRVSIDWQLVADNLVELSWVETGGPQVADTPNRGFGMDLIQKILAHELKHPVDLQFDPRGVRCRLRVPVRLANDFQIRARG